MVSFVQFTLPSTKKTSKDVHFPSKLYNAYY